MDKSVAFSMSLERITTLLMLWSALKTGYSLKAFSELETELNIIQDGDGDAPPMAMSWLTTVRPTLGLETWLGTLVLYSNWFKMQPLIEKIQDVSMFTGEQRTWWASRTPCVCATQPCAMRRMTRVQLQIWPQDLSAYFWHLLWLFWYSTDRSVQHWNNKIRAEWRKHDATRCFSCQTDS